MMTLQLVTENQTAPEEDPNVPDKQFQIWTPRDLVEKNVPPEWTIKGLVIKPTYGMLAGAEKSLKSYLAQLIAVGAAGGVPILGQFVVPEPVPVLMMCGEGGRLPYTRRLLRIAEAYGLDLADLPLYTTFDVGSVTASPFQTAFVQHLKDYQPAITIIEPYYAFHGAASEGKMLHIEGDQLVWLSHTCEMFGSSLIIGNHYNQTGSGSGLRRITGAGPAEWSDSWWIVEKDVNASDVTVGHFELRFEVGSRQWGAADYDLTIDLGPFDDEAMDNTGEITWSVAKHVGTRTVQGTAANLILSMVITEPFVHTKTEILAACKGSSDDNRNVFMALSLNGKIECRTVKRDEHGKMMPREVWGPVYGRKLPDPDAVNGTTPESEVD
jgi:hypothetical protein